MVSKRINVDLPGGRPPICASHAASNAHAAPVLCADETGTGVQGGKLEELGEAVPARGGGILPTARSGLSVRCEDGEAPQAAASSEMPAKITVNRFKFVSLLRSPSEQSPCRDVHRQRAGLVVNA
jgi:hypothetical protein